VIQRTRCTYFPGSGCAAMGGINRMHAVLGTSDQCIATYPGETERAEDSLRGKPIDERTVRSAAETAFAAARPRIYPREHEPFLRDVRGAAAGRLRGHGRRVPGKYGERGPGTRGVDPARRDLSDNHLAKTDL
jgi:hypothetical protein